MIKSAIVGVKLPETGIGEDVETCVGVVVGVAVGLGVVVRVGVVVGLGVAEGVEVNAGPSAA